MKKVLLALLLAVSPAAAQQPVKQSGSITPGHAVKWVTTGVVADGGPLGGGTTSTPGGSNGQLQYNNLGVFGGFTTFGDCTITVPNIVCTATNGVPFAASATLDTTVASNILSGTLLSGRLSGSYPNITGTGVLAAGGTGSGFTIALGSSTVTGALTVPNGGTGDTTFTANLPLIGNTTGAIAQGTRTGNTTLFATSSGSPTNGNCASWNNGNVIDAGGPCTTGGGGGTVSAGLINQIAYYAAGGTTVSGLTTANSGVLVTSAGGVPSISSTLPSGMTAPALTVTGSLTATGLVTNADLVNASTTVNGTSCTLGSPCTVTAAAGTLTGATLNSTVTASSLTSVGTLTTGVWNATAITGANVANNTIANINLAQMPAQTFKCNNSTSTANASDCGVGGVDQNILNSQVANYTIAATDCGKTIQAGTGSTGLFTLTLPSVSGFSTTCVVSVKNGDTGRGKVLSGFPSDFGVGAMLWPLQFGQVRILNGAWVTAINPGPWQSNGSVTFNVNHASGSDAATNDCLGTGASACATIARADALITQRLSCIVSGQPTIQVAQETFTENVNIIGPACPGSTCVIIQGTPGTPSNTVWTAANSGNLIALTITDYGCAIVNGFKMASSASNESAFEASKWSDLAFENIEFGAFAGASAYHIQVFWEGHVVYEGGTYVVSGAAGAGHINIVAGIAQIQGATVSLPNALTYTQWATISDRGLYYLNGTTFTGTGAGSGSTGKKFTCTMLGLIDYVTTGSTGLPGASAGTTATGCQAP